MSEQVTVNAAWLAELGRENERLKEALEYARTRLLDVDDWTLDLRLIDEALKGQGDD